MTDRTDRPAPTAETYDRMRDGSLPVVALAPSDASAARPWYDRTTGAVPGPATGTVWCARCAAHGHRTLTHVRALETCHDDGWKMATVRAVADRDGAAAGKRARAWLSRWSPAAVLTGGCRVCNADDADHTGDPRRCGVDCC